MELGHKNRDVSKEEVTQPKPTSWEIGFEMTLAQSSRYLYSRYISRASQTEAEPSNAPPVTSTPNTEASGQKLDASPHTPTRDVFSPLIDASFKTSIEKNKTQTTDIVDSNISVTNCIRNSLSWAWQAGKEQLAIKLATSACLAVLPYGITYTSARGIDAIMALSNGKGSLAEVYGWFCAGTGASLAVLAVNAIGNWVNSKHRIKNEQIVATDIRKALTGFSPVEHTSPTVTQLVSRTLQSQTAIQTFGERLFDLVVPSISLVSAITIVAPYSPLGAAGLGCFALINLAHSHKRGKAELEVAEALSEVSSRYGTREWNFLTGTSHVEIMIHGKSEELLEHLQSEREKIDRIKMQPEFAQQTRDLWVQPLNTVMVGGIGFVILQSVVETATGFTPGGPSIGQFGLITGALLSLNSSIRAFSSSIGSMLRNFPQAQLANAVIQRGLSNQAVAPSDITNLFEEAPSLLIRNVEFEYPPTDETPSKKVLRGVSFTVEPGELLAIVGSSGSGKTSLVNLLCGIADQSAGEISFNGQSLTADTKRNFWASSGYLRQSSQNLYSLTFRENIMLGAKEAYTDADLMEIAEATGFAHVMRENKFTLDTVLGQWFKHGKNLSGGQHSLLAMTRQAAINGKFLVLDEPTAGLDAILADKVIKRVCSLKDTTRILISHDYGIANKADRILVLADGVVSAIGTHDELVEINQNYREAYNLQVARLGKDRATS